MPRLFPPTRSSNDIEFSGERKRVRCNEGLDDPHLPPEETLTPKPDHECKERKCEPEQDDAN